MKILFFQPLKYEIKIMEWIYAGGVACVAALVLGLLLASCSSVVRTDFSNKSIKNAMVYYYLPESVLKIKATAKVQFTISTDATDPEAESTTCQVIEQSFTVTTETVADTRDLLTLNYTSNGMASDDIQYVVNSKGLLETVQVITEDRTPAIVESAATAFATSVGVPKSSSEKIEIKPYEAEFTVKVSDLPQTVMWRQYDCKEKEAELDFSISSPDIPDTILLSNLINDSDLKSNDTEIKGILTRPLKNIKLNFKSTNVFQPKPLPIYVPIADKSKLIVIPVKRSAFVKQVNKIAMQDGLILSNAITNPSSVEGFLSIPINIAKAIVSIPAQLVHFRYDNNTKHLEEQAKLEYEKTILSKKLELEKIKNQLQLEELKKGK